MKIILPLVLFSSLSSLANVTLAATEESSKDNSQQLKQALHCTTLIDSRLDRLACFDEVFNTPVVFAPIVTKAAETIDNRPAFWHQVMAQEKNRQTDQVFISNTINEQKISLIPQDDVVVQSNIILSQAAIGTFPPRPVLVISCLDNITRLQILLHEPVDEGMMPVQLVIDDQVLQSRWFSEENGYLIRAGRGLPGIEDLRAMFGKKTLQIRSKSSGLGSLSFDLTPLVADIKPLRNACHW